MTINHLTKMLKIKIVQKLSYDAKKLIYNILDAYILEVFDVLIKYQIQICRQFLGAALQ